MKKSILFCAIVATLAIGQHVKADIVIDIIETGGGIQADLRGDFDLRATQGLLSTAGAYNGYLASQGAIAFTSNGTDIYGMTQNTWTPFGPGGDFANWDSSSGDAVALFGNPVLGLPNNYASGQSLSSTAFKNGVSFASEGFTPGVYVTTLTNGGFSDSVIVRIGIPEPTSMSLTGLLGLTAVIRRRRR